MIDINSNPHALKALELFKQGYNCSQSVVGAWADDIGLPLETALKLSSGFGGGFGRLREVCGAFSGGVIVIGLLCSSGNSDPQSKKEMYEKIQTFAQRYKEENGGNSIICRELLGISGSSEPKPAARTDEYYKKRPCPELSALSAALVEEFI